MCKIKSVPKNGIVPSVGRKKIVSIDFLDVLLSTAENETLVKKRIEIPNANNAKEFTIQLIEYLFQNLDMSLQSKFYINIDCPKNLEELTTEHLCQLFALFQEPYNGELLWGYTTSNEEHYSAEMLIQIQSK